MQQQCKLPARATAVFLARRWKHWFPPSFDPSTHPPAMTESESFLFELVDLLEERAVARYQQQIQNDYEVVTDPVNGASFTLKNEIVDGIGREMIKEMTQEQMTSVIEEILEKKFPLPFVLVLMGYSMILLIDKVLIDSHDHQRVENDDSSSNASTDAK